MPPPIRSTLPVRDLRDARGRCPLDDFIAALVDVVANRSPEGVLVVGGRPKRRTRGSFESGRPDPPRTWSSSSWSKGRRPRDAEELRISINTVRSHISSSSRSFSALAAGGRRPRRPAGPNLSASTASASPVADSAIPASLTRDGSVRAMRRKADKSCVRWPATVAIVSSGHSSRTTPG
jgi:hypothetical protein